MNTPIALGLLAGLILSVAVLAYPCAASACSRATYLGPDQIVITTRSNDWKGSQHSNIWIYPKGIERNGSAGPDSLQWTSKYGSVTVAGWDVTTIDGMNEAGLVANVLYLAESDYGKPVPGGKTLSLSAWGQYVLDSFATVDEAVEALRQSPFSIVAPSTPDGQPGTAHLAISDPSGDSAIFEYLDGRLVIHHDRRYQVMTNSPAFDQQLALTAYWDAIGGTTMLPGTNRASDRFVRASFYIKAIPQTSDINEALASAFGVIRNVSVPLGITTPGQPNISSTQWRAVSDQKNRVYYVESPRSPYLIWIPLAEIDFSASAPVRRIGLTEGSVLMVDGKPYAGNAAKLGEATRPFAFLKAVAK
ncbi:linear amide C-N hydrolase [Pseudodesulfovibrio indicus]|uniref:Choloylglycine hydrolase n=1 Tax=Pseudodesulfovibrio indicus TaxID=1716143 RepID=A0A140D970_9BACT|nr:linear amide C-N hydrolase [Pseudodesulfovibrio indicus]AMK09737.1 choloylglycine hydrolase [Pseudodesulfovibrio indicus]TDT86309.1 choloylglycine hydrolase [Pseudodesulfovibrio indicus]